MTEKLKSFLLDDAIFYAILLTSIAIVAFLLGRHSLAENVSNQPAGVVITQSTVQEESVGLDGVASASVVASRSGTKYHLPDCPGAKQIKEANLIRFASIEAAKAAGYSAAANCLGI